MVAIRRFGATERMQMISEAAYFVAEHRGFDGGDPVADWLQAEVEVDPRLDDTQRVIDSLEERLAVVSRKLKTARRKLASLKDDVRQEWERDIDRLAKLRDGIQERLGELRKQGANASEKTRQQLEKTWDEAGELLHRVERRMKKQGSN